MSHTLAVKNVLLKADRLLNLAGGQDQIADGRTASVEPHEMMDVWEQVVDRISPDNANHLLNLQAEWKFSYPPQIAAHIVEALQDKVIGVSAVPSMDGLRSSVKSHIKALSLEAKVDRLLDLARASDRIADRATASVEPREMMDVWTQVIDRIPPGDANNLLNLQAEWKVSYPPEIAGHIVEALQDKVIGVSAIPSMDGLRSAVKSHMADAQVAAPRPVSTAASDTGQAAIASAAGARLIGRLRSRIDAVYVDLMSPPEPAAEHDLNSHQELERAQQ